MSVLIFGAASAVLAGLGCGIASLHRRISALEHSARDPVVAWKRSRNCAGAPLRATPGSAGFDLRAAEGSDRFIPPGARTLIPTGVILEMPDGVEAQIRPRSGLALKAGITVLNSPATIDSDFRGELHVLLLNTSHETFKVEPGDRIAQLVLCRVLRAGLREVEELQITSRSSNGFGSSGVK